METEQVKGRPRTERARKFERLADRLDKCALCTAYEVVNGTRCLGYRRAQKAAILLGGSVDLWKEKGSGDIKKALFDNAKL